MKFVLVINLADDMAEAYEDFTVDYDLRGTPKEDQTVNESIKYIEGAKPKPLPHSKQMENRWFSDDYSKGWNDYLEEIQNELHKRRIHRCR